ncbi:MAG: FAD-dependent oxidoreductase [Pirellulaceae bacterium]
MVCPSHVLPLAEPGAILNALKSMFQRNSPFRIKPRLDVALWSWFAAFAKHCNKKDMLAAGHAIQPLLAQSLTDYCQLVESNVVDCEYQQQGLLFAYKSAAAFESYAATNELLQNTFNEPAERYVGAELNELEPALKENLAGGWYYREDAHLRPDKLLASWRKSLTDKGCTFLENQTVTDFHRTNDSAVAVRTLTREIAADHFVVATGATSPEWAAWLGFPIPIQPGKGYSLTMPRPRTCPKIPMILPETRVAVTPMESAYRLGSTMEFVGYDDSISEERLRLLTDGVQDYLIEPVTSPIERKWFGWRPMTSDGLPIIDRSKILNNVWLAAGHNMLGLSMAPATGRLVADLITGRSPTVDPRPYAHRR